MKERCFACSKRIRWYHKKGFNSTWHEACSIAWDKGFNRKAEIVRMKEEELKTFSETKVGYIMKQPEEERQDSSAPIVYKAELLERNKAYFCYKCKGVFKSEELHKVIINEFVQGECSDIEHLMCVDCIIKEAATIINYDNGCYRQNEGKLRDLRRLFSVK